MDLASYKSSLKDDKAPEGMTKLLTGLWHDAKGDWKNAHDIIDGLNEDGAAWAHAYLHRKEGDAWNADYWYRQANRPKPDCTLNEEWEEIVRHFLS